MSDQRKLEKFSRKAYRDGYLRTQVRGSIAYQMQALREKTGLNQTAFAELTEKKQSTISRLEDTEYGKVTVQTLLDIACALNVALVVRFVSYPEFLKYSGEMSTMALQPETISESISAWRTVAHEEPMRRTGSAFASAFLIPNQQETELARSDSANDNATRQMGTAQYPQRYAFGGAQLSAAR